MERKKEHPRIRAEQCDTGTPDIKRRFVTSVLSKVPSNLAIAGLFAHSLAMVANALSTPITLELTGGNSWNGQQAVIKAEFGSLRRELSQATLQCLDLLSHYGRAVGFVFDPVVWP